MIIHASAGTVLIVDDESLNVDVLGSETRCAATCDRCKRSARSCGTITSGRTAAAIPMACAAGRFRCWPRSSASWMPTDALTTEAIHADTASTPKANVTGR